MVRLADGKWVDPRVLRSGVAFNIAAEVHCAVRGWFNPFDRYRDCGIRVVLVPPL